MVALFQMVGTVAKTNSTVLVTGESGTGKEMVARAIHENSLRREHPFVALNCGAVPETLLESELFGHMKGAFTGADTMKKGLVEVAERGTIFLDEIGEMNATMQVKLLRVLQDRRFRRLGGTEEVQADIRVVAATNQDLAKIVGEGKFREDLYYRINVIEVHLPPLRDRREDIPRLAAPFARRLSARYGQPGPEFSADAMRALLEHAWPGNVRELEHVVERALLLCQGPAVQVEDLALRAARGEGDGRLEQMTLEEVERHFIQRALTRCEGQVSEAARVLGLSRSALYRRLQHHGLKGSE
jgi:DNA-binding NtrC family response regulator